LNACLGDGGRAERMELTTVDSLQRDRIDKWTANLGSFAMCSPVLEAVPWADGLCGPDEYCADSVDGGAIVFNRRSGPELLGEGGHEEYLEIPALLPMDVSPETAEGLAGAALKPHPGLPAGPETHPQAAPEGDARCGPDAR